ncbi:cupin domain-containing protein [Haloplanus pelagicus]|uniref:cupin domain-containing protein n=1 Tax=Haloplanus pelagicus TaxID=2949995 RepID=UPI00203B4EA5|nr:cupin domain-containing protein [Haloplanus sp. HW8-1]
MVRHYHSERVPAVYNEEDIPKHDRSGGATQWYFRGFETLMGITNIPPGSAEEIHSHPWEQIVFMLDGSCRFHVDGETKHLEAGDVLVVPPEVEHGIEEQDESGKLLFTGPLREDMARLTEYQEEFVSYD